MTQAWSPNRIAWAGGLFIALIVALAAYEILRSYRATIQHTRSELETQAQVIAEQTARSVQAIDVVLRHIASEFRRGRLSRLSPEDVSQFLTELAVGLKQIDGIGIFDADGESLGVSWPSPRKPPNMASLPRFQLLRDDPGSGFRIFEAAPGAGDGLWIVPFGRRLETADGRFAGVVAARGRVDYFQEVYRAAYPDPGSRVALVHPDSALLARHPPAEEALGRRLPLVETLLKSTQSGAGFTRNSSPVDGIDRFGAFRRVPEYGLTVVVSRDAASVLAPWRSQALGTALRTLALAMLASVLLWLLARQVSHLDATRRSLQATQDRFALAVAGSDDGIWVHDFETGRAFNSRRARELVGMPDGPEDIALDEWLAELPKYIHPDDLPGRKAAMEAHLAGRTPIYEVDVRHRKPDGSHHWVRIRGVCVRDATGKPLRMAGSVSDVNARIQALERLRENEQRFALAVAGSNDGIIDWDVVNDRMYASERAMEILGIDSRETTRPRAEWTALVHYHPEDQARMSRDLEDFLAGRTEVRDGEYRVRLPDGRYRWIRHRNRCVRGADGRPLRVAGSVSDIDAQKRAEAHRASLEGQLLQAKKLEAIGTLAGGIAHDFNNILAAILGYGEMAQKGAPAGTPLRRHLDAVVAAGLRAKSLVERILAFSRSGIGERAPVRVQAAVAEALEIAAASLPPHVRLERRLEAGDASVLGDATQIHQVVMNLVANGAQAMKSAGTLAVSLEVADLDEDMPAATSELPRGRYVRLAVRDSGPGIPAEVRERMFDPFFTTKGVGVGTGLGLSLVHGIVTDLGGGIDVASREDEGTTFSVYLPVSARKAAAALVPEAPPAGNGQTVLLVDDEETLVRLGEEAIAALGYEPVGFSSSRSALEAFRADPARFHAVLSDEAMPDMTGTELAREIRRLRPDIPIALLSGFISPALTARARELGVNELLAKPLVAGDLARCLGRMCA